MYPLSKQDHVENDFMASIGDPSVREVIAKETLTYKPKERPNPEQEAKNVKALENLIEVSRMIACDTRHTTETDPTVENLSSAFLFESGKFMAF